MLNNNKKKINEINDNGVGKKSYLQNSPFKMQQAICKYHNAFELWHYNIHYE